MPNHLLNTDSVMGLESYCDLTQGGKRAVWVGKEWPRGRIKRWAVGRRHGSHTFLCSSMFDLGKVVISYSPDRPI